MHHLNALLEAKERERGIPPGSITIATHIETPLGLLNALPIAKASPRVEAMGVGPEDSCFALGVEPSDEGIELLHAVSQVITICRAVKIRPHGLLGSVAGFGDLSGFERAARRGRQLGTEGAGCIHPDQIPILHKVFSPTPESAQHARRILQAYEEGVGRGTASVNLDGKMVDIPVYHRAKIILESAEAIEAVERRKAEALARIS